MLKKSENYIFSSSGVDSLSSSNEGKFSVNLNQPIGLAGNVRYASLEVSDASIWNSSPNISPVYNNNILTTSAGVFEIPSGSYGVDELQATLSLMWENLGLNSDLIILSSDESTQKLVLSFFEDIIIQPSGLAEILGFEEMIYGKAGKHYFCPLVAKFNRFSSFYIRSNLVSAGIPINTLSERVIAKIPITARPGSLINYNNVNPPAIDISDLVGQSKQGIWFALVDDKGRPIIVVDDWSVSIRIYYYIDSTSRSTQQGFQ
jgi:hypothetical protein